MRRILLKARALMYGEDLREGIEDAVRFGAFMVTMLGVSSVIIAGVIAAIGPFGWRIPVVFGAFSLIAVIGGSLTAFARLEILNFVALKRGSMQKSFPSDVGLYKPTLEDTEWAKRMVSLIKDGGILGFPTYGHQYRVDHRNKRLILLNPVILNSFQPGFVIHQKTVDTFAAIGWTVS